MVVGGGADDVPLSGGREVETRKVMVALALAAVTTFSVCGTYAYTCPGLIDECRAQAPVPPPASPANGARLISLDFKDADVVNLLRILAAESSKNIVIGADVEGKISIALRNVPWEVAFDTILEARGLRKIEKDNVILIVSTERLLREREAAARLQEATLKAAADIRQKMAEAKKAEEAVAAAEQARQEALARGPLREETIRLFYADPVEVARTLRGILGIPPQGLQASPLAPPSTIAPGPGGLR